MGERLKPAVLKTVSPERGSGVRIPLPPPAPGYRITIRFNHISVSMRASDRDEAGAASSAALERFAAAYGCIPGGRVLRCRAD